MLMSMIVMNLVKRRIESVVVENVQSVLLLFYVKEGSEMNQRKIDR
jgi:hypothetical protein